jgi:septum formation protein
MPEPLILASGSAARARVLEGAGVHFVVQKPALDEEAVKEALRAAGRTPREQAAALAEAKALSVSAAHAGLVLGADQMLAFEGRAFDKPHDRAAAKAQLQELRGGQHELVTAIAVASGAEIVFRHLARPRLTMRAFSDAFLETYLDRIGSAALTSVGAYQIEGLGAQLFSAIEGDYFSILGLPLLPLLDFLRERNVVPA